MGLYSKQFPVVPNQTRRRLMADIFIATKTKRTTAWMMTKMMEITTTMKDMGKKAKLKKITGTIKTY